MSLQHITGYWHSCIPLSPIQYWIYPLQVCQMCHFWEMYPSQWMRVWYSFCKIWIAHFPFTGSSHHPWSHALVVISKSTVMHQFAHYVRLNHVAETPRSQRRKTEIFWTQMENVCINDMHCSCRKTSVRITPAFLFVSFIIILGNNHEQGLKKFFLFSDLECLLIVISNNYMEEWNKPFLSHVL